MANCAGSLSCSDETTAACSTLGAACGAASRTTTPRSSTGQQSWPTSEVALRMRRLPMQGRATRP
ncbi:MAG: hypothetical protein QM765_30265 [Myxococcales bacterium]